MFLQMPDNGSGIAMRYALFLVLNLAFLLTGCHSTRPLQTPTAAHFRILTYNVNWGAPSPELAAEIPANPAPILSACRKPPLNGSNISGSHFLQITPLPIFATRGFAVVAASRSFPNFPLATWPTFHRRLPGLMGGLGRPKPPSAKSRS